MRFLYPLGLLGLIGIPVIIIIYILQSKYTEQTVNSNYLWHLSDKFLKHKNPLSGITGLISLILQVLMIAVISLAIARPVFTLPNAANNYCFVLDVSGSMNMVQGKETRLDMAKDEIIDVINDAKKGSTYSLICVSDEAVRAFELVKDKKIAIDLVNRVEPTHTNLEYSDALTVAQECFDKDTSAKIYFVTDKSYAKHDNIEILSVGTEQRENYAVFDVKYTHTGGNLNVSAEAISYTEDKRLDIKLYVDGKDVALIGFDVKKNEKTPISFSVPCEYFAEVKVEIQNADGYMLDNSITTYNQKSDKSYSVLIVSESGFFFESVIDALVDSEIKVVSLEEYETITDSYGLYIFDSCEPSVLPNGAVWLINADESIENSGFSVRGKHELYTGELLEKSKSTSTVARKLLNGVGDSEIYITDYVKYSGMYLNFYSLFTYDSNPIIFAGSNGLGYRQVVFGFDIYKSDFALSTDFVMLAKNLIEYSFPNVVDDSNYTVGEDAVVNILTGAKNLKAVSPSGKDIYIEADGTTASIALDEVGAYTVSMSLSGKEASYKIYSSAHPDESVPTQEESDFSLSGQRTDSKIDGEYEPFVLLFVLLVVIFIADWGVYCYEKYQLR